VTRTEPGDPLTALGRLEELAGPLDVAQVSDGVVWGRASVAGLPSVVFATEPKVQGGALGAEGCRAIAAATDAARIEGRPVLGLWHSGGARLQEGVGSLVGMGALFTSMTAASGRVPQVAVVLGPAAGGAAYGPALADVVISAPEARLFVTGPDVVRQVTGEQVDALGLGGPDAQSASGLLHVAAGDRGAAYQAAHDVVGLLAGRRQDAPPTATEPRLAGVLPERRRQAYDVRRLVDLLVDEGEPALELHPKWAPNVVTALGRLEGRPVGILANNPWTLAGCLDAAASDKAARFVRMCDSLGVPLVVVVDTPGYLPGVGEERGGIVRRGAKLLHAFAEATVPRVTLVTHKAYGGAYIAMNSRALGATAVLAWPGARIGVMGPEAAAQVLHRRELATLDVQARAEAVSRLAQQYEGADDLDAAVAAGAVDAVVVPEQSRVEIAARLRGAAPRRGTHGNIPL
jgi:acetyl-CoA/propionyl-CoA carboxylase carboxyl transferase subunit